MRDVVDEYFVGLSDDEFEQLVVLLKAGVSVTEHLYEEGIIDEPVNLLFLREISDFLRGLEC